MALLADILTQGILLGLIVLLGLCALIGAAVAWRPALLDRLRSAGDRRTSVRRAARGLDIPRVSDRLFYRHHRTYGAAVVLLAIFLLYVLVFGGPSHWQSLFPADYRVIGAILVDWARIVLWLASVFALIVGTVVFVRPSALKRLERTANRWVTPRRYTYALEREYRGLDRSLARHPRLWGIVVACLSVICTMSLAIQWASIA